MSNPFRLGFIGAGGISHAHAAFIKQVPGVELACAADPSRPALDALQAKHGVQRLYTDLGAMLAAEAGRIDAVTICTPNACHASQAIAALDAGLHVLVEKPMAMNADECMAMLVAAGRADRKLVIGFQWRFDVRIQLLRRLIAEGRFGRILHVRAQALRRRGIPSRHGVGNRALHGGGALMDIGVHVCEMAHYAIGSPSPAAASGSCWSYIGNRPAAVQLPGTAWDWREYTVDDLAVGTVRFATGTIMHVEAAFAAHIDKDVWNLEIRGENGGCTLDPFRIHTDHDGFMWDETPRLFFAGYNENDTAFEEKMRHFVAVCRGERENCSSGEDGLQVQRVIDGIYASHAAGGSEVALAVVPK